MSRTASVETVNRGERSCVHPTPKMIDPLLLKCFQILFLIVAIYIVLISSGRIINSITGRMIIPSEYLNNCGELYVRLYDYTKSELNTILILIFILAGYMVSIKGFNNFD